MGHQQWNQFGVKMFMILYCGGGGQMRVIPGQINELFFLTPSELAEILHASCTFGKNEKYQFLDFLAQPYSFYTIFQIRPIFPFLQSTLTLNGHNS